MRTPLPLALLALLLVACAPATPPSDAGPAGTDGGAAVSDAGGTPPDAGDDAGEALPDAGEPAADAGGDAADAGDGAGDDAGPSVPAPGFGAISGPCGVLDDELTSAAPALIINAIDFADDPYDDDDLELLTEGGQEMISDGNAGGSSLLSEVFAFEVLDRCEGAALLKTETEVSYRNTQGKITDLLVEIDGLKIGVSVTRAVAFPFEDPYTAEQAQDILETKLQGVLDSSANVAPEDAWQKQILHVIAYGPMHATALDQAWDEIDAALKADTIVYVTVSNGSDAFLY